MQALFTIFDVLLFFVVAFVTVAALVTAIRCKNKAGNQVGAWILFLGCLIGLFSSFGFLVLALLPKGVLYDSGFEVMMGIRFVLGLINLVSTAVMVAGIALFRPKSAGQLSIGGVS